MFELSKRDIESRKDLYIIVSDFYKKLMTNDEMLPFFVKFSDTEVLEEHLQILVNFWEGILFFTGGYRKNAMQIHLKIHKQMPFKEKHFKLWLSMFNESVDAFFMGKNAHTIKSRAESIAIVMKIKISEQ